MNGSASESIETIVNPIIDENAYNDVIVDEKNEQIPICSPIISNNIIIEDDYGSIKVNLQIFFEISFSIILCILIER